MYVFLKPGEVWVDADGAALLILEEEKALVLESLTVIDFEDVKVSSRLHNLESNFKELISIAINEQKKHWD